MVRFPVDPKTTALLVVDMTNDFVKEGMPLEIPAARAMVPRLKELIGLSRQKGVRVIYTAHVHHPDGRDMGLMKELWDVVRDRKVCQPGTEGPRVWPDLTPAEGDILIEKHRYDAFYNTDLELILKSLGINTLIITGTMTNLCCESTARSAMFRDYRVIFVSDLNATIDIPAHDGGMISEKEIQRIVCSTIALGFGEVVPAHELSVRLSALPGP